MGDSVRVRQVLMNLVGNAIKFTEKGEVVLRLNRTNVAGSKIVVRFEVIDTGIGIADADRGRLFVKFTQLDGSVTRRYGGTGLGLAISKQLVELMGGRLEFESELGMGSRFFFELPFDAPAGGARASVAGPMLPVARAGRVLVVDDNATSRLILEEILSGWGMAHASAETGPRALHLIEAARLRGEPFALVILDMQMPDMTGLDIARRLRSDHRYADLKLLLLTSLGRSMVPTEAAAQWVDSVLVKPIRQAELGDAISLLLGAAHPPRASAVPSQESRSGAEPATRARAKVLIVDDNAINTEVMAEMLTQLGYSADVACHGRDALAMLETNRYPLVFMDCQMPVMDGYAATRELRRREADTKQRMIVVAVTAHALAGERAKTEAAGMDDFVTKPLNQRALAEILEKWLGASASAGNAADQNGEEGTRAALPVLDSIARWPPKVVALFEKNAAADVQDIEDAAGAKDAKRLRELAHRLNGGCRVMGAARMAQVSAAIEAAAKGGSTNVGPLVVELKGLYAVTCEALGRSGQTGSS
jgi:CheY-like chemotaxis protein